MDVLDCGCLGLLFHLSPERYDKYNFYGDNYERLLEIKRKYDPSESLFIWSGLGSDMWNYDLKSGLLCCTS